MARSLSQAVLIIFFFAPGLTKWKSNSAPLDRIKWEREREGEFGGFGYGSILGIQSYPSGINILTLQPLGIIFERSPERKFAFARRQVVQITPEDNRVRLREFRIRARILLMAAVGSAASNHRAILCVPSSIGENRNRKFSILREYFL